MAGETVKASDYLDVLRRRWLTLIWAFLLVMGAALLVNRYQSPVYRAWAEVVIEGRMPLVPSGEGYGIQTFDETFLQTQYEIVESRLIAREAARNLEDMAKRLFPGLSGSEAEGKLADYIQETVRILPRARTRMFRIAAETSEPDDAALIANTVADSYVAQYRESRRSALQRDVAYLTEEIGKAEGQIAESEQKLQGFRKSRGLLTGQEAELDVGKLAEMNSRYAERHSERLKAKGVLTQAEKVAEDPEKNAAVLAEILSDGDIEKAREELSANKWRLLSLSKTYRDKHPKVIELKEEAALLKERLQVRVQDGLDGLRARIEMLSREEEALQEVISSYKKQLQQMDEGKIQYSLLERDVEANREIHGVLLSKLKQLDAAAGGMPEEVRIIESAIANPVPVKPRKVLNMLLGGLVGIFLGIGVAFLKEYLDETVRTEDEVESEVRLPVLGTIPAIRLRGINGRAASGPVLLTDQDNQLASEAYRQLRANLQFAMSGSSARIGSVLVTSPCAKEGKSTVAANLGLMLARAGKRVLVVDSDLRRPALHRCFSLPNDRGLTDVLKGEVEPEGVIVGTGLGKLWLMTSGTTPNNPSELLSSETMRELVRRLEGQFDLVILDSPPVMAVADPAILASASSGAVLVLEAGSSLVDASVRARRVLGNARTQILGAVLNKVSEKYKRYYGYYRYSKTFARKSARL